MGSHKRSRLGCKECKKRKIKCDEIKPICTRCINKDIDCQYETPTHWMNNLNQKVVVEPENTLFTSAEIENKRSFIFINIFQMKENKKETYSYMQNREALESHTLSSRNSVPPLQIAASHSKFKEQTDVNSIINDPFGLSAFDFYCKFTAHLIVAAPSSMFEENPFCKIVPEYARTNSHLMSIVIAYALIHKSTVLNRAICSQTIIDELFNNAKSILTPSFQKPSADENVVLLVGLMLTSFQLSTGAEIIDYSYLNNALKLFLTKYLSYRRQKGLGLDRNLGVEFMRNPFNYFVLRWLGYLYIMLPLMSGDDSVRRVRQISVSGVGDSFKEIRESRLSELWRDFTLVTSEYQIDMILGFSVGFLSLFDELIELIEESNYSKIKQADLNLKALLWKSRLTRIYEISLKSKAQIDPIQISLGSSNIVFYHAGLIHLYRRVLKIPKDSFVVQESCRIIKDVFENELEAGTSSESCSVFALFIAGCECSDEKNRSFFKQRLKMIGYAGNRNAFGALEVLIITWASGKSWTDVVKDMNRDFYLL